MKIIKSNSYNFIHADPFDIPLPTVFELYAGNTLLVEYSISEDGVVNYNFNPNTNEKILTSTKRPLELTDIYFLLYSRVIPDNTPYTKLELDKYELDEYNPFSIIQKSHGIMPGDNYWIRFLDQDLNYKKALKDYQSYNEKMYQKHLEAQKAYFETISVPAPMPVQNIDKILQQKDIDFDNLSENINNMPMVSEDYKKKFEVETVSEPDIKPMSDEEINSMFDKMGLIFNEEAPEKETEQTSEDTSSEKMSDDAIAAMFANLNAEPEPAAEPAPTQASSEKMSDDAIAAMFANLNAEPEPAAEPAPTQASSEKMSDDAIAAMFANLNAEPEPAAEPTPTQASSEKMSDDAIAAMFANLQDK